MNNTNIAPNDTISAIGQLGLFRYLSAGITERLTPDYRADEVSEKHDSHAESGDAAAGETKGKSGYSEENGFQTVRGDKLFPDWRDYSLAMV